MKHSNADPGGISGKKGKGKQMKKKELEELKVGTWIYNGHQEGIIKMHGKIKGIEIFIPFYGMNNDSRHFDDRPEEWELMDD